MRGGVRGTVGADGRHDGGGGGWDLGFGVRNWGRKKERMGLGGQDSWDGEMGLTKKGKMGLRMGRWI